MAQETKYNKEELQDIVATQTMSWVSLHTHTTYSYMDGFKMPSEHVARVAALGMKAVAFTEHGNVSSHVKLEQAALRYGVKPIFGLEAYTAPPKSMRKGHMTILAMDQRGYRNLMRIVTRSWQEGYYKWPTVHGDILRDHSAGLIVLSGCADSHLNNVLLGGKGIEHGDKKAAERLLRSYVKMFGDRFYLETQRFPGLPRTCEINQHYADWSSRFDIPLAGTADVHYPLPEHSDMQRILHSAGRGSHVDEADWEYTIKLTYPLSDAEIIQDLVGTGLSRSEAEGAVANTAAISERCNVVLPKMDRLRYPIQKEDLEPWGTPQKR